MNAKDCGKFVTDLRKKKNLTQKQLAEILNVSDKAISRWETGKGFPDVNSLLALSEFFGVSVNELLAGKRIEEEKLTEIAEENVIQAIETKEKEVKKKKLQMVICSSLFIALILPAAIPTLIYSFDIIASNVSLENGAEFIGLLTVAVFLVASGFAIKKGHISLLHSYHYRNVVDRDGYCNSMGKGIMLMSIPTFVCSLTSLFPHIRFVQVLGTSVLIIGYVITVALLFKYQYKYNGGLF
ncbi:MAG: helix-turn-helix domain-containing protein [Clostridia bacterium]|nr:helix-turn-helix domain-containing protein [Clostridia bacterium]